MRGGHIDACMLGNLQVDGRLAKLGGTGKWCGMGGAMDLVTGRKLSPWNIAPRCS